MTFDLTFKFPAQNNGMFPGKTSAFPGYDLESAVYDMECEGWGNHINKDDALYETGFRDGFRHALTATLQALPIGIPLTFTGDTHQSYYAEPVTITVTRTE